MNYGSLVFKNLFRNKVRTSFTLLTVAVTFALFGALCALTVYFSGASRFSADNRIFIYPKYTGDLPLSYVERIKSIDGLALDRINYSATARATYRDDREPFTLFAVSVPGFIASQRSSTRFIFDTQQLETWQQLRSGAMITKRMAAEYDLKVGDRINIYTPAVVKTDGTRMWEFQIAGIFRYEADDDDPVEFWAHYEYFNEGRISSRDRIRYIVNVLDDASQAGRISAEIDALFRNSSAETRTGTEDSLSRSYYKSVGNISSAIYMVLIAIFLIMLLVICNSMIQSLRERVREIAVMKTIGFNRNRLSILLISEGVILLLLGGTAGFIVAYALVEIAKLRISSLVYISGLHYALGYGLMMILGILVGALPAVQSQKLTIAEALRKF